VKPTSSPPVPRVVPSSAYARPKIVPGRLKLDSNEGARPDGAVLEAVPRAGPDLLRRYPDAAALEATLGERFGLPPERVFVSAGADEAIDRACRAFLEPGSRLVMPDPSFDMFERSARLACADVAAIPWPDGPFPLERFTAAIDERTRVIAMVTPNNPTGGAATRTDFECVVEAAGRSALVVLDHAYVEYADEDLTARALELPNVVVLRTLSKAWGLAGCRVGYSLGHCDVIGAMRAAGQPYSVSAPSIAIALEQLRRGDAVMRAHVQRVRREREWLAEILLGLGLKPRASQTNFVTFDCGSRAATVKERLAERDIAVRTFPRPDLAGIVRITLPGSEADFDTLVAALHAVFADLEKE